jgi:hypothetical protein
MSAFQVVADSRQVQRTAAMCVQRTLGEKVLTGGIGSGPARGVSVNLPFSERLQWNEFNFGFRPLCKGLNKVRIRTAGNPEG